MEDIRYKQRFDNYQKAFLKLKDALAIDELSEIEKAGVIQYFEITFELAWKLMKDYLLFLGYSVNSPRDSIKRAFSIELISNGDEWLNALTDRNLTVHTYNQDEADAIFKRIKENYYPLLESLYLKFKEL